jgi:polyisoprenyl-phosphate glycosyltransferase
MKISVVVPVFNEEVNIEPFLTRIIKVLNKITNDYEIIFSLDPSKDKTEEKILNLASQNKNIKIIIFSRRFGQPAATIAGINNSTGDCCVVIDVDLQDPPELIEELYVKFLEGYEVVLAKRKKRKGETFLKKIIASFGYKLINFFSEIDMPIDTGDFRLISKKVVEQLKSMKEPHNFLRGMVAYIGFKQCEIVYDRDQRFRGDTKYNKYLGSIKIALNGLLGFSSKPLHIMTFVGFILSMFSFSIGLWYLIQKLLGENYTAGLPTSVLLITFFSGVQLLALGLIGEYIGRIYDQVKQRPPYIIEKKINFDHKNEK